VRRLHLAVTFASILAACGDDDARAIEDAALPSFDGRLPPPGYDPFAILADPLSVARPQLGRARLASSRAPDAPAGFENNDFDHFVRLDADRAVIFDERGPGVVTRLWLTLRNEATGDQTAADRVVLRVEIDGREVLARTLGDLTSGAVPGFGSGWSLGRDQASGAFLVLVPIAFADHAVLALDRTTLTGMVTFYQVDWRALPPSTSVRPFSGELTEEDQTRLVAAAAALGDGASPGEREVTSAATLAPGDALDIELTEPAVLRRITVALPEAVEARAAVRGRLLIDAEIVVDESAALWLGAAAPALPYRSAAWRFESPASATLRYPAPVATNATLSLVNDGAAPIELEASVGFDPGAPPADLGRLRIACAQTMSAPASNIATLDVSGARGQLAGHFVVLDGTMWGWQMMEGDHEVEVDGAYAILGTGTEDYFGGAFYFIGGPFSTLTSGAPGFDLHGEPHASANQISVAMYRHHILDAIDFETSIRFEIESFAPTLYRSCGYWYSFD